MISCCDRHLTRSWRLATLLALAATLGTGTCSAAEDLVREATSIKTRYAAELDRLAAWCRQKQLKDEARRTLKLIGSQDPSTVRLPILPREVGSLRVPEGATGDRAEWYRRLMKLRQDQAAALYNLAQRCARRGAPGYPLAGRGSPWLGYRLVLDAIRANPDHEPARRVLGYVKYQNRWHTPYEVRMVRGGMVWNDKFGWIEKGNLPRYQRGERLLGSTWIDAASDAALHSEITSGWDVETEHYRIRTNVSIEAAAALGARLEDLNRAWRQIFLGYYATAADVESLLNGKPAATDSPEPMDIVYFRNKQQYHQALKPIVPEVGISMGLYVAANRTAYFYAGSDDSQRTMYHEATHQLFQQSRRAADGAGEKANCWLIEGIALYMETFRREGDCFVLGDGSDARMAAARYHLAKDDFYVPFDKLVRLGVHDIQTHPEIAKLYSQIAAMTSFLVHYDGGRYRDALVSCLAAVYDGNQDPQLLARMTRTDYAELDKQYRAYMKATPE
jgi:hypothetical protein